MRRILNILTFVSGIVLFWVSLSFVNREAGKNRCTSINIEIPDSLDYGFVNRRIILREIQEKFQVVGKLLDSICTDKIEVELGKYPSIRDVQVYRTIADGDLPYSGRLIVRVYQREPLFRVMGNDGNFYVDKDGKTMPLSPNYTARVPIVQGNVKKEFAMGDLFDLLRFIGDDSFWGAQIGQIYVTGKEELLMVPRVGDHIIEFGKVENYKRKFEKLMALYKNAFNKGNWNEFSRINLKYENQIVCTRNK